MSKIIISGSLPPIHFDKNLLSVPIPKFSQDSEDLWNMYLYIRDKLMPKAEHHPAWSKKVKLLEEVFLKKYEWVKAQEEDNKAKTGTLIKRPWYNFSTFNIRCGKLFRRFTQKSRTYKQLRNNDEI